MELIIICIFKCLEIVNKYMSKFCLVTDLNALQMHVPYMTKFMEHVSLDDENSDSVVSASCGLIG